MRTEMRQLLTPRMIQSMEILQLPLMALEERIEQELTNNPVLELREPEPEPGGITTDGEAPEHSNHEDISEDERALVVKENSDQSEDFDRLTKISDYLENEEFGTNGGNFRQAAVYDGERDKKLDAMNNTAARGATLSEYLLDQWTFVECSPAVRKAGEILINYIDAEGYFRTKFEDVQKDSKIPLTLPDLQEALTLIQTLEPSGVGARNLPECLLIQLNGPRRGRPGAFLKATISPWSALITEHLKDLEMNRYPQISRKLGRPIDEIQRAVRRLARLACIRASRSAANDAPPVTPDAIIYYDPDTDKYEIEMTNEPAAQPLHQRQCTARCSRSEKGTKRPANFSATTFATRAGSSKASSSARRDDHAGDPHRGGRAARVFRQGAGIFEAAADDPRGRPARHSRGNRSRAVS
jgi:RNA polymerase sigma-54 factor